MKRLFALLLLVSIITIQLTAQSVINLGIPETLFNAATASVSNSTAFAIPGVAVQCTWQTSFTSAPASVTLQLQTSLDNLSWAAADSSTVVAGDIRTFSTSAGFLRARINAVSGGSGVTVIINCKAQNAGQVTTSNNIFTGNNSFTGNNTYSGANVFGNTTTFNNVLITGTCTGCGSGGGSGNVSGPPSVVDGNYALWDGTSGTLIKDGGVPLTLPIDGCGLYSSLGTSIGCFGFWDTGLGTPGALTATLIATGTGNIDAGAQTYKVTFVDANGFQTLGGTSSNTVTTDGTHKQIALSNIPLGPTGTVARQIYRQDESMMDDAFWSLSCAPAWVLNDNTTTILTDNVNYSNTCTVIPETDGTQTFTLPGLLVDSLVVSNSATVNLLYTQTILGTGNSYLNISGGGLYLKEISTNTRVEVASGVHLTDDSGLEVRLNTSNGMTIIGAVKSGNNTHAPSFNWGCGQSTGNADPCYWYFKSTKPTTSGSTPQTEFVALKFGDDDLIMPGVNFQFGFTATADGDAAIDAGFKRIGTAEIQTTDGASGVGIMRSGYKSSDGTTGATTTCTILGLTSITVKNGLITSCS